MLDVLEKGINTDISRIVLSYPIERRECLRCAEHRSSLHSCMMMMMTIRD